MSKDLNIMVEGRDWQPGPLVAKWDEGNTKCFSLEIKEDGKIALQYNATAYTSTQVIPDDGWVSATFDSTTGNTSFRWAEKRVTVKRYRVKPWKRRWWKPWDSIETYTADETVWEEL